MGWSRLLLLLAIAWLLALGWGALRRRFGPGEPRKQLDSRKMVQCAVCDIYVPEASATRRDGRFFCGDAHAEQGGGPGSRPGSGPG